MLTLIMIIIILMLYIHKNIPLYMNTGVITTNHATHNHARHHMIPYILEKNNQGLKMASISQDNGHQQYAVSANQPTAQDQQGQPHSGAQTVKVKKEGGFECEFVERPPEHFLQSECPICLLIIRDPYQVTCCGYSFCHSCIQRIKTGNKPCPTCNEKGFSDFPNKGLKCSLYAIQVRCSHQRDGCEWTGELGQQDDHLNTDPSKEKHLDGCRFAEIDCLYCDKKMQRQYIQTHQIEHCSKRPFTCTHCHDYESTYDNVIHKHWPVCGSYLVRCQNGCGSFPQRQNLNNHVAKECPLTTINCDFFHVGCEVKLPRNDMSKHLQENLVIHTFLLATKVAMQQIEITDLKAQNTKQKVENEQLQQELIALSSTVSRSSIIAPTVLTMTGFDQHKKDGDKWYSSPVYTHCNGYKICLRVDANDSNTGSHVSAFICFMKGEFDNSQKWPIRGVISFRLLDQLEDKDHITWKNTYSVSTSKYCCSRVTGKQMGVGYGRLKLIAHTELKPKYLRNDTLLFQIHQVDLQH